ncbi:hypothetical protein ATB93_06320 [Sphingomonas sp. WG]|nr:hypothetical protein ATB93_06320 [Sphingomonas sp. WG]
MNPSDAGAIRATEDVVSAWSSGFFTAWCEAVMTPWNLVPPPHGREAGCGALLPIPDVLEEEERALFA